MSRPRFIALLLAFITIVVFLPVAHDEFINYDDPDYATDNPHVENGLNWTDLKWAATTDFASNWHPLTWISLQTDATIFGLNAGAFHIVNVLFHTANVTLLFLLLLRLTERLWPSALVAALFAWHPLHIESVAWVSERKDVLSTFFALLALLNYVKFARENCRRSFWFALVFFALGLLAKPMLVTLPFVFLLLDAWPLNRVARRTDGNFQLLSFKPLLFEKWPFFLLTAISCVITFIVQNNGHAVTTLQAMPIRFRLENAPVAVMLYVLKLFWPVNLAVIYPLARIPTVELTPSLFMVVSISAAVWRWRISKPYLLTGWLWFLGTLVPVIGLVQVGSQSMADRYAYIPSIGFFLALVLLACDFAQAIQIPKVIAAGIAAVILAACILQTEFQLQFWANTETLFRHALAVTKNNDGADLNLGLALESEGKLAEALEEYHKTLLINPNYPELHNNLGLILDQLGRHTESLAEYRIALSLRPDSPFRHNAVGSELATLGQFDAALKEFAKAKQLDPKYSAPYLETAKALFQLGRDAEGVPEFQTAAALDPDNFQVLAIAAHYFAADENAAGRDGQAALALAVKADDLSDHSQPMVLDILAMAYAASGDFTNAQACARKALDLANTLQMGKIEPLRQRLELYNNHRPWRESFRATNAPAKN
ncbi:MAG: tetratricopeptide repeat protein [Verrucomicrobiota bacterium]